MALDQDIERLARVPLLETLEPDALRLLAFSGESRTVPADTMLFRRGEPSNGGFLVLSGAVLITGETNEMVRVEPGGLIGETTLLRDVAHTHSAMAQELSTLFELPRKALLRVLEEHPVSARRLLAFLARRLHAALPAGDGEG